MKSCECLFDLIKIMAVDPDNIKSERFKLGIDRFHIHDVFCGSVDLKSVDIHRNAEVVKPVLRRIFCSFPDKTLGELSVSQKSVDIDISVQDVFGRVGHSRGCGKALPERAGGEVDPGCHIHIGMTLEMGTELSERDEVLFREIPALRQYRVEAGCTVSFGKDEAVAVLSLGILRIDPHLYFVEVGHEVDG